MNNELMQAHFEAVAAQLASEEAQASYKATAHQAQIAEAVQIFTDMCTFLKNMAGSRFDFEVTDYSKLSATELFDNSDSVIDPNPSYYVDITTNLVFRHSSDTYAPLDEQVFSRLGFVREAPEADHSHNPCVRLSIRPAQINVTGIISFDAADRDENIAAIRAALFRMCLTHGVVPKPDSALKLEGQ
jgi:hypothetical protein